MPTRILLADDHALIRQGLKALLETQGFQVVGEASDGLGTLRLAEKTQPDVAILDISMPVLNGMDAARELKKSSPNTGRSNRGGCCLAVASASSTPPRRECGPDHTQSYPRPLPRAEYSGRSGPGPPIRW